MPKRKTGKRGGADTWANWMREKVGVAPVPPDVPAPTPSPVAVPPLVGEGVNMVKTAGKRVKKHIGFNPASPKDARKLLKTAKGDNMLGRRRKTVKRRRS